jgi:hypothetical protein
MGQAPGIRKGTAMITLSCDEVRREVSNAASRFQPPRQADAGQGIQKGKKLTDQLTLLERLRH